MALRRKVMAAGMGGLPSAYQRVEYLEGNGDQYIDTMLIPSNNFAVEITQNGNVSGGYYFGCFDTINSGNGRFALYVSGTSGAIRTVNLYFSKYGTQSITSASSVTFNADENTVFFDKNGITVNGVFAKANADSTEIFTSTVSAYLFGVHSGSIGLIKSATVQIKSAKIYNSTLLVRNFIPCVRKSDSKPGMYDTVSNTFYTNAGTGEFVIPA